MPQNASLDLLAGYGTKASRRTIRERSRFRVLTRHFFHRLFLNDTVFLEEQMTEKVVAVITVLAGFFFYVSENLMYPYLWFPDQGTSWMEKSYILALVMVFIGLITVVEWNVMFLDRRDFLNLVPLPLKPGTVLAAKFASLALFVAFFAAGMNSLSSLVFTAYLGESQGASLTFSIRIFLVHMATAAAAGFFVFFSTAAFAGLLAALPGGRFFRRLSGLLRYLLMLGYVVLLFLFLSEALFGGRSILNLLHAGGEASSSSPAYPHMWFTGLYEVLLGNRDPFFMEMASMALSGLALALLAFFLAAAMSYRRRLKSAEPAGTKRRFAFRMRGMLESAVNHLVSRNSVQRSVFWFFGKTLAKSQVHRMRLAAYLVVGAGFVILQFILSGREAVTAESWAMRSIPFILSLALLLGVKDTVNLSLSLDANWIFRLTENPERRHYFAGLRKAVLVFCLVPLFLLLTAFYGLAWGWPPAARNGLYAFVFAVALLEGLFFRHRKIPFACSYLPGKGKIHVYGVVYLGFFLAYTAVPLGVQAYVLARPSRFAVLCGAVLAMILAFRIYDKFFFYRKHGILYEEHPTPVMVDYFSSV
ncbi:MAG: hypothetical protein SCM96_14000 [Acidobacteriota bacterium]|nr:hypothetical protein [Acidobacteriota bacterium]